MTPEPAHTTEDHRLFCNQQHYQQQLQDKITYLCQLLAPLQPPEPEIFTSPPRHYRMRAEFRLWHEGNDIYPVMFHPTTRQRIKVDQFPAASQQINTLLSVILPILRNNTILREKLFQLEFLTTTSQQALISLIYHRSLDNDWQDQAQQLRDQLRQQYPHLHLIGRAHKCKIVLDQDYIDEQLTVAGNTLIYRQPENSFTQPNATVNIHMLEWALQVTNGVGGDLLELYCGNGNFSLALARQFRRVLATEISKASVSAAQYNIAINQIDNVHIARLSAKEFSQAISGVRRFHRLRDIDLTDYQYRTVLVDPPRAGLEPQILSMIQGWPHILYISCNPDTLYRDLQILTQHHHIARLALFDQFPYTRHIECGVWLTHRAGL